MASNKQAPQPKNTVDNRPASYVKFENELIFDKILGADKSGQNDKQPVALARDLLQKSFGVDIIKEIAEETVEEPDPNRAGKKIERKIKKVNAVIKGGTADKREHVAIVLKELGQEMAKRQESVLKSYLDKPAKLATKRPILGDKIVTKTNEFVKKLNNNLAERSANYGIEQKFTDEEKEQKKAENSAYNADVKNIKKMLGALDKRAISRLNPNQPIDALRSHFDKLYQDFELIRTFNVNPMLIEIQTYMRSVEEVIDGKHEAYKSERDKLFHTLSKTEQSGLVEKVRSVLKSGHVIDELQNKGMEFPEDRLLSYAKNAVYKMQNEANFADDEIRKIVNRQVVREVEESKGYHVDAQEELEKWQKEQQLREEFKDTVIRFKGYEKKWDFIPRNKSQAQQIRNMEKGGLNIVAGPAGTGKTHTGIAFAASKLKSGQIKRIIFTSPMEELGGKNTMGFLPGGELEKMGPYVRQILRHLIKTVGKQQVKHWMGLSQPAKGDEKDDKLATQSSLKSSPVSDMLDNVVNENPIQFQPLASVRGNDYEDAIIFVDEAQNMRFSDAKAISTRAGRNTSVILCGDHEQTDIPTRKRNGEFVDDIGELPCLPVLMRYAEGNPYVRVTKYAEEDIVRSPLTQATVNWFKAMELNSAEILKHTRQEYEKMYSMNKVLIHNGNYANQNAGAGAKNGNEPKGHTG